METTRLSQEHRQIILDTISTLAPCTAFAFGYRSADKQSTSAITQTNTTAQNHHIDVLVFSSNTKPNAAIDAANLVRERSNGEITVSLLLHKPTDLTTRQPCLQWFFWHILHQSQRLCLDKTAVPYLSDDNKPTRDVVAINQHWLKCEAVAGFYLNTASENPHLEVELIKVTLLHQAAQHTALGLIRIFLGYTPNEYNLSFLLSLCAHFTNLPSQCFPRQTPVEQKRFKMLCAPPSMLRHWNRLDAHETDFDILLQSCKAFLTDAKELAATALRKFNNQ
ncbi:MAG TPA: hypothetical protein VK476_05010 [Flavobacterium sp.]|nr:hypothetical protein [Flavobacterium sp.]